MEKPLPFPERSVCIPGRSSDFVDVLTESRSRSAGEFEYDRGDSYHLALWQTPSLGEARDHKNSCLPYRHEAGTLSCFIPGDTFLVRAFTLHKSIFSDIRPQFLQGVEAEMDVWPQGSMRDHFGFTDPALRNLLHLLRAEVEEGGTHGTLYSDSLNVAVATRLLLLGRNPRKHSTATGSLPALLLRRSVEYMEANLGFAIDIATLARQTGYSRAHFIKMFAAATGSPPHRFLLGLRLERAKALISIDRMPLVEAAAVCGFSSQTHLTTAFRRCYGFTPAQFARTFQKSRGWPK